MVSLELDEGNKMDNICHALIKYTFHNCYKKATIKESHRFRIILAKFTTKVLLQKTIPFSKISTPEN